MFLTQTVMVLDALSKNMLILIDKNRHLVFRNPFTFSTRKIFKGRLWRKHLFIIIKESAPYNLLSLSLALLKWQWFFSLILWDSFYIFCLPCGNVIKDERLIGKKPTGNLPRPVTSSLEGMERWHERQCPRWGGEGNTCAGRQIGGGEIGERTITEKKCSENYSVGDKIFTPRIAISITA